MNSVRITVGMGSCGIASGADAIYDRLVKEKKLIGLDNIEIVKVGCIGICRYEPIVEIYKEDRRVTYINVKEDNILDIIEKSVVGDSIIKELAIDNNEGSILFDPFYKQQKRIVLSNCGNIDPEEIAEYESNDGYKSLRKVLTSMSREEVLYEVKSSGLRGRGGAGFPTGTKWEFAYKSENDQKYVCCNADEGDPGAFMDRAILEGDPHSVIEAMAIAGYTIGSNQGYIYVREEYPLAVERLKIAINQAREKGYIGKNKMGSNFSFDLE